MSSEESHRHPGLGAVGMETALIVLGAAMLMIPVMINGFPLLFQDSADYLIFTPRLYRSPFYGIFIFIFHLNRFIWGPIIIQSIIGSHLIYLSTNSMLEKNKEVVFLISIFTLSIISTLPEFIGFIMPDIFASYLFIIIYLIGFQLLKFNLATKMYLIVLACIATASHLSYLTMAIGMLALFVPLARWIHISWPDIRKRAVILAAPILLTIFAYLSFNLAVFRSFSLSPASRPFYSQTSYNMDRREPIL